MKLAGLCTKIGSGATPRGGDSSYKSSGISLIRSQNVLDLRFSSEGLAFIDDEQAEELSNVTVQEEDVLLNITGDSVARVCKVPASVLPARVNQHVSIIRTDRNKLDSDFLLYQLISIKDQLLSFAEIGATRRALTKGMIENLTVNVPDLIEQHAIASVLSSLDDKIDLLHRQNKTLEKMGETLFRQWFVEEADERLGEIKLSEIADHLTDSLNPMKTPDAIHNHYSIPAFDEGREPRKELGKEIRSNKFKVYSNSILISKLNPRIPRVWPLFGEIEESSICSTEFQVVRPKDPCFFGLIYCFLKSSVVRDELANAVGGTSGSHQRVDPTVIFNLNLTKPPSEKVERFDHLTTRYWVKIKANDEQIHTLTQTRDTLLPKLMSAEVRVDDSIRLGKQTYQPFN